MLGCIIIFLALCGSTRNNLYTSTPHRVDRIEVNTVRHQVSDWLGKPVQHVFRQVIIWSWHPEDGRYHVQAWFSADDDGRLPRKVGDQWQYTYYGRSDNRWHTLVTDTCIVTTTERDVEVWDRQQWPDSLRRPLPGMPSTIFPEPEIITSH